MKTTPWREIRAKKFTKEEIETIDREVEQEALEMDLKAIREFLGKTQQELAALVGMTQPEVSRMESREDHRLSTLKRIIEALGGRLEITAYFGDKKLKIAA